MAPSLITTERAVLATLDDPPQYVLDVADDDFRRSIEAATGNADALALYDAVVVRGEALEGLEGLERLEGLSDLLVLSLIKSYRAKSHKVVPVKSLDIIISRQAEREKGKASW